LAARHGFRAYTIQAAELYRVTLSCFFGIAPAIEEKRMSDIKLRTGEILYEFPSDVAHALICLGLAEKYIAPPPEKKVGALRFAVERVPSTGEPCIKFSCPACSQSGFLLNSVPVGTPARSAAKYAEDAARAFAYWHCGKKETLAEAIIAEFTKAYR